MPPRCADPRELFFTVALDDVGRAADLLRPAYDASGGRDGFVSFECTPDVADDTGATVEQALELWSRLARPNVMIKVPATDGGGAAIEELTARGVNVNVTLLFSVARYEEVIDAYIAGLERRIEAGQPVDGMASVASFFVSRIDARADAVLPPGSHAARPDRDRQRPPRLRPISRSLLGPAMARARARRRATATAAVGQHRDQGPRVLGRAVRRGADRSGRHQHDAGGHAARLRRPRHRRRAAQRRRGAAEELLREAGEAGVDLDAITSVLERDGVRAFCDSYRELLSRIETVLQRVTVTG